MPQWFYWNGSNNGSNAGIPAKHLQCAAVQILALNFKLVGFGPGNGEAAVGQSFTQAHYCLLYDCRVGESLWMANCHSVGKAEIPLPDSLWEHSSAAAVYLRKTLSNVQLLHGPSPLLCSPAVSEGALGQPCGCCFLEQSFQVAGNCVLLCEGGSIICWLGSTWRWPHLVVDKIIQDLVWTKFLMKKFIGPSRVTFSVHS